jgi:hypothetical protein
MIEATFIGYASVRFWQLLPEETTMPLQATGPSVEDDADSILQIEIVGKSLGSALANGPSLGLAGYPDIMVICWRDE